VHQFHYPPPVFFSNGSHNNSTTFLHTTIAIERYLSDNYQTTSQQISNQHDTFSSLPFLALLSLLLLAAGSALPVVEFAFPVINKSSVPTAKTDTSTSNLRQDYWQGNIEFCNASNDLNQRALGLYANNNLVDVVLMPQLR
jgi:hypothetical protein